MFSNSSSLSMNYFEADSHIFSAISKLSDLEEDLALYEDQSSRILRRYFRTNRKTKTLTYSCQDKKKHHCPFSLVYSIMEDDSGVEWAVIQNEKTKPKHSQISKKNCCEIDFESMRRGFKGLEQQITKILLRDHSTVPKSIMEHLILGDYLTEAMNDLNKKYPKRFKKCLDNQTNKIKRKIKKKKFNGSDISTIKPSNSSSFFSDLASNSFIVDRSEVKKNEAEETKIIFKEEDVEIQTLIPIVFY